MFAIIGLVIVTVSVFVGFAIEGGPIFLLLQPVELMIIGGAAVGGMLIGTPPAVLSQLLRQVVAVLKPSPYTKRLYLDALQVLYELLVKAKKNGLISLEKDLAEAGSSAIFTGHPLFLGQKDAVHFTCEALSMLVDGTIRPDEFDAVLDVHLETHHEEELRGVTVLQRVGDTLPGLGIVAAVLGIVITMQHIDGKPAEIGHHVAVALVGTFLGILLSYGYVQPLANSLEARAQAAGRLLRCIKGALVTFAKGAPPLVAVEVARHGIFSEDRPHAEELAEACRNAGSKG
jgi:chemotaxis protein MotA